MMLTTHFIAQSGTEKMVLECPRKMQMVIKSKGPRAITRLHGDVIYKPSYPHNRGVKGKAICWNY